MLVSDIIMAMTKPKKEILHEHIEDNPQKFIGGGGSVCLYITLHNSKQPVLLVLFGSRGQIPFQRDQMTVKKQ